MMRAVSLFVSGMIGVALVAANIGCASDNLADKEIYEDTSGFRVAEDTEIPDETKYREVLQVVLSYRNAVVDKDFGTLNRLIDEDYYDNAGTTDTTEDDFGREQLEQVFEQMAEHAEQIKYNVTVEDVRFERQRAYVEYEYKYAYKYQVGDKPTWDAGVEVNQIELVSSDGEWKIIKGL